MFYAPFLGKSFETLEKELVSVQCDDAKFSDLAFDEMVELISKDEYHVWYWVAKMYKIKKTKIEKPFSEFWI